MFSTPKGERKLTITKIDVGAAEVASRWATSLRRPGELSTRTSSPPAARSWTRCAPRDVDPYPHEFDRVEPIAAVRAEHESLAPGEETDARHRVAGRLVARRGQGKMAFLDLLDRSGKLQLQARVDELGADGHGAPAGVRSRRPDRRRRRRVPLAARRADAAGPDVQLLAKSLRPPPEKHHGLTDVETRFRHRELDLIANEETRALFITRARVISAIRRFLDGEGFIEVETPVLQPLYGGALARPFTTHHNALDRELYLRIATELYLKRLIVGGLERVYELGKDFRNEGVDTTHNPEFTMLEWYEAYADYLDVADRFERLIAYVAARGSGVELPAVPPRDARRGDPDADRARHHTVCATATRLPAAMRARGLTVPEHDSWPQLVDELVSKHVEPTLTEPTLLLDYPVELSPFAKQHRSVPMVRRALRGVSWTGWRSPTRSPS